ncbi:MAG: hypothetical protein V3V32_04450 [Dehalococcoidia bacterium]
MPRQITMESIEIVDIHFHSPEYPIVLVEYKVRTDDSETPVIFKSQDITGLLTPAQMALVGTIMQRVHDLLAQQELNE